MLDGCLIHLLAVYIDDISAGVSHACGELAAEMIIKVGKKITDYLEKARQIPSTIFIPDLVLGEEGLDGPYQLLCAGMPYHRFTGLFRHLLTTEPFSLEADQAREHSTYSLRRFLPSEARRGHSNEALG